MSNEKKQHQIEDLREMMFKQMERLACPECDLEKEIKRASAINGVGKIIVDSAKAEVDFMRVAKAQGSGFLGKALPDSEQNKIGNGE